MESSGFRTNWRLAAERENDLQPPEPEAGGDKAGLPLGGTAADIIQ